ncbi:hypothetical protein [Proteiniclasticum sp. QWL-01]|uniref:hypothetical protein n=1 Tax=Proteiniclasticum sp. QWL-01 TaxID=3036945 RepID=UPI0024108095|nr:hypothetical protein [Proteiniclasticum sp. QWL-01]WFF73018.1 hypothetical protein P6M73_00700 [Proteiniclasticum sp. QWL-01]
MKKQIMASGAVLFLSLAVIASAGIKDFDVSLPWLNKEVNATSYQRKTTSIDGSNVLFNSASTGSGYVYAYTKIIFSNSGTSVKFSPKIKISTTSGINNWLGAYSEYNANINDQVQLVLNSDTWNGDRAAGKWDYK